ncbi:DnaJ-like protein subfamily C member 19 [Nematocida sp. AWRm78]|nr:DnaJ-like protein subfamily C member 19 [Nematocida sp. AWRm79]KAI5183368.1 DnaJ-like protein subfamily C member 19 [Nematocida sp. AWRm78]
MGINIWRHSGFLKEMTVSEAMSILGVFSIKLSGIDTNYRMLVRANHPDSGGSEYLSQKVNEAREFLLNNT